MSVGYIRTSKKVQNLEIQRRDLEASGCEKIFEEQISSRGSVAWGNVSRRWGPGKVQDQHPSCPRSGNHMSEGRPRQMVTRASDQACRGPLCSGTPSGRRLQEGTERAGKNANLRLFGRPRKTRHSHPPARRSDRPGRVRKAARVGVMRAAARTISGRRQTVVCPARQKYLQNGILSGALGRTRTCDLLIRRPNRAVLCGSLRCAYGDI